MRSEMMWTLILLAVHISNPNDVPGKIEMTFQDQQTCLQTLSTMTFQLKFDSFKVVGKCERKQ